MTYKILGSMGFTYLIKYIELGLTSFIYSCIGTTRPDKQHLGLTIFDVIRKPNMKLAGSIYTHAYLDITPRLANKSITYESYDCMCKSGSKLMDLIY
jgi:hypothetical protein